MKLIGLLSWFDEPTVALTRCLAGLSLAGVDHVVAVDGRYALFDAPAAQSAPQEYAAVVLACRELGMTCTIHQPAGPWADECAKRTFLFGLGWAAAAPGDWFWVQDADQWVLGAPPDLRDRLAATNLDVAEVLVREDSRAFAMRSLFRAQPLRVEGNHFTYVTADGRRLWGRTDLEAALDLTGCVTVAHCPQARDASRAAARDAYYERRNAAGVELGACELCDERATSLQRVGWRVTDAGLIARLAECCDAHADTARACGDAELAELGVDPASVQCTPWNGQAPRGLVGVAADHALIRHATS